MTEEYNSDHEYDSYGEKPMAKSIEDYSDRIQWAFLRGGSDRRAELVLCKDDLVEDINQLAGFCRRYIVQRQTVVTSETSPQFREGFIDLLSFLAENVFFKAFAVASNPKLFETYFPTIKNYYITFSRNSFDLTDAILERFPCVARPFWIKYGKSRELGQVLDLMFKMKRDISRMHMGRNSTKSLGSKKREQI